MNAQETKHPEEEEEEEEKNNLPLSLKPLRKLAPEDPPKHLEMITRKKSPKAEERIANPSTTMKNINNSYDKNNTMRATCVRV